MRFAARVLICVVMAVTGRELVAAETGSSWWPFSHHEQPTVSQPPGVAAPTSSYLNQATPSLNQATPSLGPVAHEVQLPQSADASAAAKSKSWLHMPSMPKLGSAT